MSISKAISRQATNSLSPSSGVFNPKISNVAATALQTKGNVHITIPQKFFSFNTAPVQDNGTTTTTKTPSTPASRFQKRNEFFLRRHVSRDHIIRAQHYDIRIAAISMTETLKDAVRRHKMIKEEASYWGPFAAGTTMYASFLRGDERVKVELAANNLDYPWNVEDEASPINTLYVEGFAVGEVRGFANFDQIRALRFPPETETKTSNKTEAVVIEKESESTNENENESESENKIETLSTNPLELPDIIPAGDGIMKVTKIMYGADRPYTSTLRTTGNPTSDWQEFYNQSEQVPTYLFFSSDIDKNNRRSPRINATTLRSAEDIILAEDDIEFCGGVLIQVLAGPSDPELATRILSQRAELSSIDDELNTTTISEIEGESKAPFDLASLKDLPSVDLDTPSYENETDDEYVKRIQLEQLRNRAQALDMPKIMKQNGVAGFVAALLDIDVESLGKSPSYKQGNVDNEYDFESLENHLIQTTNLPEGITEEMLHESDKYQCKKWQYRPVALFCRCTQTPPVEKLQQLPNTLLHELVEDGGAEFTCEYCNTHTVISLDQITQALHEKQHSSIPVPEAK